MYAERFVAKINGPQYSALARDPRKRFKGSRLRAAPAAEPTNVQWENLHVTRARQWLYGAASVGATTALIVVTFVILVAATRYLSLLPPTVNQRSSEAHGSLVCDAVWPLNATSGNADAVRATVRHLLGGTTRPANDCKARAAAAVGLFGV